MFSFTAKNVPWYHVIVDTEGLSDEAIAKRKTELIDIAVKQGSAQASPALSSSDISGSTTSPAETPTDTQRTELRVWLDEYSSVSPPPSLILGMPLWTPSAVRQIEEMESVLYVVETPTGSLFGITGTGAASATEGGNLAELA